MQAHALSLKCGAGSNLVAITQVVVEELLRRTASIECAADGRYVPSAFVLARCR